MSAIRASFALVVALVSASVAFAGIDFVPHPRYPAPNYFAGTNARAFYHVSVNGLHNHIAKVELYLNDIATQTLNTPCVPGGGGEDGGGMMGALVPAQDIAVMFDSFYFQNGQNSVTVKCRVLAEHWPDGAQQWFEHTYSAPGKNKAAIFSLQELEDGTITGGQGGGETSTILGLLSYPYSFRWQNGWMAWDYRVDMNANANVYCYFGHSNVVNLVDGRRPYTGPPSRIFARTGDGLPSIEEMRATAISYPWPPFNDSGIPALNIAAHFSCLTTAGNVTNFTILLYPFYNGYGKYLENQAFMGFGQTIDLEDFVGLANPFWLNLTAGHTIERAVFEMMSSETAQQYGFSVAEIKGDANARIRRVYFPGNAIPLWWRAIAMP